jgi:hypothetical protein
MPVLFRQSRSNEVPLEERFREAREVGSADAGCEQGKSTISESIFRTGGEVNESEEPFAPGSAYFASENHENTLGELLFGAAKLEVV